MPKIEKNIPVRQRGSGGYERPYDFLNEMEVLDSVCVDNTEFDLEKLRGAIRTRNKRFNKGVGKIMHRYTWDYEDASKNSVRIWRVE